MSILSCNGCGNSICGVGNKIYEYKIYLIYNYYFCEY